MNQSLWGRNYGHGEVKVAELTDNVHALSWDLCRLAFFNKAQINDANTRSAFAFQVKGPSIRVYINELVSDGVYLMSEIADFHIVLLCRELWLALTEQVLAVDTASPLLSIYTIAIIPGDCSLRLH
ncbi:hypothetical protein BX666DRAFT_2009560 [Dichotomocladium elegans]|nr:hypothetical protein BX666DRAFT_2009560 [Dichotomocladium elegans]